MMMVVVMVMIYGRVLSFATQSDMTRTVGNCVTKTGKKRRAVLRQRRSSAASLLCLTKIGGLDPKQ